MGGLLSLLQQGSQSLTAQRGAMQTASHNLENAATPGYARQRAEIQAAVAGQLGTSGYLGQGALLGSVTQVRDRYLESQIPAAAGASARSSAESTALSSISALNPAAAGGLTASLGTFYANLRALSQSPGDGSLRASAVEGARGLAASFRSTTASLESARSGLDEQLTGNVSEVNQLAQSFAQYNRDITTAQSGGGEASDLLDQRLKIQDRLVELTGAHPIQSSNGEVTLALANGASLVTGNSASTMSLQADPANGGHLSLFISAPGATRTAIGTASVSGAIGGALSARDVTIRGAVTSVDQLAFDLAASVNAVHKTGFASDGSTGRDLLEAGPTAAGAASRMAVQSEVDADPRLLAAGSSAAASDGTTLLALIGTETAPLASGNSPDGALASLTSAFGLGASRAKALAEHDSSLHENLVSLRESASGVSIDEETIAMLKAQRAFEAVSKVITVTNSLLDTLMRIGS